MSNTHRVYAGPDGRAGCGEGFLIVETVDSNPASGMNVCT